MRSKSVVLPAPFGPMMPRISPSWSSIVTSSTAVIPAKRLVMPWVSSDHAAVATVGVHRRSAARSAIVGERRVLRRSRPRSPSADGRALEEDRTQQVGTLEQLGGEAVEADRALLQEERPVGGGERDVRPTARRGSR